MLSQIPVSREAMGINAHPMQCCTYLARVRLFIRQVLYLGMSMPLSFRYMSTA